MENFQIAKVPSIFGGAVLAIISKQPKGVNWVSKNYAILNRI